MTKKLLYLCVTALMGLFASCSQDETPNEPQLPASDRVTLTASLPDDLALSEAKSRALPSREGYQLRCILEVWTQDEKPALVQRIEQVGMTGEKVVFDFEIEQGTYDCLFWADFIDADATSSEMTKGDLKFMHYPDKFYYTSLSSGLKLISYTPEGISTFNTDAKDAFFGNYVLRKGVAAVENQTIPPLTRPFAKLTVKEKSDVAYGYCSSVTVTYSRVTGFNVLTGKAETSVQEVTYTGKSTEANTLFFDYIFTDATSTLGKIDLKFDREEGKELYPVTIPAGIPLKRNHKTNVSGHLISEKTDDVKFVVTIDEEWDTPDEEYDDIDAKVGDFYFSDNTWSPNLVAGKKCIGIVFDVNEDGKSGKIVSLEQGIGYLWAKEGTTYASTATEANNPADGMANMKTIKTLDEDYSDFPAFKWCADRTEGGLTWYLPAPYELQDLYAATCGLKLVDADPDPQKGEVERWNISTSGDKENYLIDDSNYTTQRAEFMAKMKAAGGAEFNKAFVSSCEDGAGRAFRVFCYDSGSCGSTPKDESIGVRAIAKFPQ